MPHSANLLGRVCLAAVLLAVAHRTATLTVTPKTGQFVSTYYAVVGKTSELHGYLNDEFHQLTSTLLSPANAGKKWRAIPLERDASMPGGDDSEAEHTLFRCSGAWNDLERKATALYGRTPSVLLFALKFHWNYATLARMAPCQPADRLIRPKIIAWVDDLHWYDHDGASIQQDALAVSDVVLSTYANVVPSLYPFVGRRQHPRKQLAWLPHATTPQFFLPRRSRSSLINAILLSGATSKDWYPYRHAAKTQLIQRRRDPRFAVLDHPGYSHFKNSTHVGPGFASELNRYAACLTDGLHLNYTIAKVLEIPAAGCLLLVNREMTPMMARLGLYDGVHFLSYRDAGAGLVQLVEYVLDLQNAGRLDAVRRRAQHLVWRTHLVAHRAAAIGALAM